jgi:hypothetical protein
MTRRAAVKVLCAGCPKEEREEAEATVRRTLGARAAAGAWTVSLVRMADKWSVTLDGPAQGVRGLSFVAPRYGLAEAIAGALAKPASPAMARAPEPRAAPSSSHQCESCRQPFVVIDDWATGSDRRPARAACPHCWHLNQVLVSERAAETGDYRTEKV